MHFVFIIPWIFNMATLLNIFKELIPHDIKENIENALETTLEFHFTHQFQKQQQQHMEVVY